ncbi:MAG: hypothetical protein K2X81_23160, partial [Candidatus Obscuribacterales bacterium]|nr:hypothetical protein [Candidatus Obscuribacterales bacterium]
LKKSLISKLRVMSIESDQKLGGIVDESKSKIEERIAPSLAELKAVADEKLVEAAFAKLQAASDEFATSFADSLGNLLDKDLSSLLGEAVKEELARLNTWRTTELESFSEYFEQTLIQLKQNKNKGISSLDTCVNSMTEELRRLKDFDLQRLALLKTEVNETFEQVREHSHMRLTQHCDKALAEKILPLLSQRKSALGLMAHEMRQQFAELLDAHSNESLAEFDVVLGQGKDNMTAIETSMSELKIKFETDGKKSVEDAASALSAHLDTRVVEIKDAIEAAKEDSKTGAKGAKDRLKQRAEQTRKDCVAKLNELYDSLSDGAKKQQEDLMAAFETRTGASSVALAKEISEEIESLKARREVAQMKIEKMLETLTEKAEAIPAEFIQ